MILIGQRRVFTDNRPSSGLINHTPERNDVPGEIQIYRKLIKIIILYTDFNFLKFGYFKCLLRVWVISRFNRNIPVFSYTLLMRLFADNHTFLSAILVLFLGNQSLQIRVSSVLIMCIYFMDTQQLDSVFKTKASDQMEDDKFIKNSLYPSHRLL